MNSRQAILAPPFFFHRDLGNGRGQAQQIDSQRVLGVLVNNLDGMVFRSSIDAHRTRLFVSDGCQRLLGYAPQDLIGNRKLSYETLIHADDRTRVHQEILAASLARRRYCTEYRIACRDGQEKWVRERGIEVTDENAQRVLEGIVEDITDQVSAQRSLANAEARYRSSFENVVVGLFQTTIDGYYLAANSTLATMYGYESAEELMADLRDIERQLYVDPRRRSDFKRHISEKGSVSNFESQIYRKDGTKLWISESAHAVYGPEHELLYYQGIVEDIDERKHAEASLRVKATAFESKEGMLITDANSVILRVNHAFTEITGYSAEDVVGRTPRLLKSDRHNANFYREMWDAINQTGGWQGEIFDRRKNGEVYLKWLTITAVRDEGGHVSNYIGTQYDITERKKAEEKILELAFFDQLTGLPNRTLLLDRLKQTMAASSRSGNYGAVLFIDLDDFKKLNDTLGHGIGDMLLKQVAQRLTSSVREGDTVGRLGGDEFVVVLAGLGKDEGDAATGIEAAADKILAALNQPYLLDDLSHHCTASIGATSFIGQLVFVDDLMKQADLAMYKSKAAGRNLFRFFDPTLELAAKERAVLEADLWRGLDEKQFLLHYQAQVEGDGRVTGVEVLLRWQHPQRGIVPPSEFIPLVEESGLILSLGQWVLETACTQLAVWANQPNLAHLTIAVNVSAHQFNQTDFVDQVLAVLNRTGANPQRLKLELTESVLTSNLGQVIEKMVALKAKGVGFALDDFGSGFSSLSFLKRLPLDQLKIDSSFVRGVLSDPNDAAIAKTVVALARNLGLDVIAEGVETVAQWAFLASSGCHAFQGNLFSQPMSPEGFEQFAQHGSSVGPKDE